MLLDATTRSIKIKVDAAAATNESPVVVEYADLTTSGFAPGASTTVTNGSTYVTAVAAPAASTQRQVKEISVYNLDTIAHTFTVIYDDNGTQRILIVATLPVGYTLQYLQRSGWKIVAVNDSVDKIFISVVAPSGVGLTTNIGKTVTSIPLVAGDWLVFFMASFNGDATTVLTNRGVSISLVDNTVSDTSDPSRRTNWTNTDGTGLVFAGGFSDLSVGPHRLNLSAATTVYGAVFAGFSVGAANCCGTLLGLRI